MQLSGDNVIIPPRKREIYSTPKSDTGPAASAPYEAGSTLSTLRPWRKTFNSVTDFRLVLYRISQLQSSAALMSWRRARPSPGRLPAAGPRPHQLPATPGVRAGGRFARRRGPSPTDTESGSSRHAATLRRGWNNETLLPTKKLPPPASPGAWEWEEAWGWISTAAGGWGEAGERLRSSGRSRDAGHHADLAVGPLGRDVRRPARGRGVPRGHRGCARDSATRRTLRRAARGWGRREARAAAALSLSPPPSPPSSFFQEAPY